jgi:phage major head subunit gpT-like protein
MAQVTPAFLSYMFQGFNTRYNDGFHKPPRPPQWGQVAMKVDSIGDAENYAWLGQMPRVREWIGDRVVKEIADFGLSLKNKDWESTITVERNRIQDDKYNIYGPMAAAMGNSAAQFPDEQVFAVMVAGFSTLCYDGQNLYDANHPVLDANGVAYTVSNVQAGAGAPWFLVDSKHPLRPFVWQERQPFEFVSKFDMNNSDYVFATKKFLFGVDARYAAGPGLWQTIFGSQAALNRVNFRAAYAAMLALKYDYGRPMAIIPDEIWVGPSNQAVARDLFKTNFIAVDGVPGEAALVGAAGVMANADEELVKVVYCPWLP